MKVWNVIETHQGVRCSEIEGAKDLSDDDVDTILRRLEKNEAVSEYLSDAVDTLVHDHIRSK